MNICVYETTEGLGAVRFEGNSKPDLPIGARTIAVIFDQPEPQMDDADPVHRGIVRCCVGNSTGALMCGGKTLEFLGADSAMMVVRSLDAAGHPGHTIWYKL